MTGAAISHGAAITPTSWHSSSPWFDRGGCASDDSAGAGLFSSGSYNGATNGNIGFRVALLL